MYFNETGTNDTMCRFAHRKEIPRADKPWESRGIFCELSSQYECLVIFTELYCFMNLNFKNILFLLILY